MDRYNNKTQEKRKKKKRHKDTTPSCVSVETNNWQVHAKAKEYTDSDTGQQVLCTVLSLVKESYAQLHKA